MSHWRNVKCILSLPQEPMGQTNLDLAGPRKIRPLAWSISHLQKKSEDNPKAAKRLALKSTEEHSLVVLFLGSPQSGYFPLGVPFKPYSHQHRVQIAWEITTAHCRQTTPATRNSRVPATTIAPLAHPKRHPDQHSSTNLVRICKTACPSLEVRV